MAAGTSIYADRNGIAILPDSRLGFGQDGSVWKSDRDTAVKAFLRDQNYESERDAYIRFRKQGIRQIGPFNVPELIGMDDLYLVLEIGFVTPSYLLDFGKAYVDRPSPYTDQQIADSMDECRDLFDADDWVEIESAMLDLKLMGIIYLDIKPANIRLR